MSMDKSPHIPAEKTLDLQPNGELFKLPQKAG
jgi:hypothetical protein